MTNVVAPSSDLITANLSALVQQRVQVTLDEAELSDRDLPFTSA